MLKLLKTFLSSFLALFAVAWVIPGISYQNDPRVLLAAALIFTLFNLVVRPILNLLTLPFNFLTLGLVSAVINVGLFYTISYVVPAFTFSSFTFYGLFLSVWETVMVGAVVAAIFLGLLERVLNV